MVTAKYVHEEVPIRLAKLIRALNSLPYGRYTGIYACMRLHCGVGACLHAWKLMCWCVGVFTYRMADLCMCLCVAFLSLCGYLSTLKTSILCVIYRKAEYMQENSLDMKRFVFMSFGVWCKTHWVEVSSASLPLYMIMYAIFCMRAPYPSKHLMRTLPPPPPPPHTHIHIQTHKYKTNTLTHTYIRIHTHARPPYTRVQACRITRKSNNCKTDSPLLLFISKSFLKSRRWKTKKSFGVCATIHSTLTGRLI